MSVNVRVRNGMETDAYGDGGVSEGDVRGGLGDIVYGSGVLDVSGGHLEVTAKVSPDMNVIVAEGVGYIPNSSYDDTDSDSIKYWEAVVAGTVGSRTLAIGSNSSGQTRIDIVCLKINTATAPDNTASNIATLIVVAGTAGAGVPATPSYYEKLAEVTVVNGATEITTSDITDTRAQVRLNPNVSISNEKYESHFPTAGSTLTLDLGVSNDHRITMPAGNITIALANGRVGQKFMIGITQPASGNRTVTWFSTIRWEDGVAPVLTPTANKRDWFGFICTGSATYDGFTISSNL